VPAASQRAKDGEGLQLAAPGATNRTPPSSDPGRSEPHRQKQEQGHSSTPPEARQPGVYRA